MLKILTSIAVAGVLAATASISAFAAPIQLGLNAPGAVIEVSGGCGPHAWRGPWGHCRDTPYYGRLPNGSWRHPSAGNGCPPGYWHGPWGHCRNTPFHGRLPNGEWV